jgi:hypothetical protein
MIDSSGTAHRRLSRSRARRRPYAKPAATQEDIVALRIVTRQALNCLRTRPGGLALPAPADQS